MRRFPNTAGMLLATIAAACLVSTAPAAGIEDAESSAHGFEAASYQVIDRYEYPGFQVVQFDLAVLSHFSYLLISKQEALVVDPGRDVAAYLEAAEKAGARISGVWLTHSHADFVAGQIEIGQRLGVPIYISRRAEAGYEHTALEEGDTLRVGDAVITFLETPGHTPDSMCALVANARNPDKPLVMFTGDTLFVGSVGRPDLLGEGMSAASLASMMFDTWTKKLSKLPDDVVIMPAHGAGSLCGAHLSDEPVSTIGQQRFSNPYLLYTSRGEFVAAVLDGLPEAPHYFAHNAAMNKQGAPLVDWNPAELPSIEPSAELTDAAKHYVVDVREAAEYAAGHVPRSVNIALRGRFETWTGIMVPWDAELIVAGNADQLREAIHRLHRVGYQARTLSLDAWRKAGLPLAKTDMVSPAELHARMQQQESPVVVDVRLDSEWEAMRIGMIVNLPLTHLGETAVKLDRNARIVTVCNSAYRSSLAVGVLERRGFANLANLAGGTEAWSAAGLPLVGSSRSTAAAAAPVRAVKLADRLSAAELKRMMMDLPGTFELVDVRPPAHYADYHLPGSANVDVASLLSDPAYLDGEAPLVVVDRDGSLAMMAAGILSQKTGRRVMALYGGLEAYWAEADFGATTAPSVGTGGAAAGSRSPSQPPAGGTAPAASPPKKRSAGC